MTYCRGMREHICMRMRACNLSKYINCSLLLQKAAFLEYAGYMTGRSAAGPCGGGGACQRYLAARAAARDSPAGDDGRTDDVELLMRLSLSLACGICVCARVRVRRVACAL